MFNFKKNQRNHHIDYDNLPKHIAIIMDGNGRWAKKRGLPRSAGHGVGGKTLEKILNYIYDIGIKYVTIYAFSTENLKRPKEEVDELMKLFDKYLRDYDRMFEGKNVILRFIGTKKGLSDNIIQLMDSVTEKAKNNTGSVLNVALNYGGREEIVHATRQIAQNVKDNQIDIDHINEEYFKKFIYTADQPDPDFIIRPSGEKRLSNFLLWQCAYSELWFSDVNWPDFSIKDLNKAIIDYQSRNRRFGGI